MVGPVAHANVGYADGAANAQSQHREDWSMNDPNRTRYVGLDVHKDTIAIAVADREEARKSCLLSRTISQRS